MTHFAPRAVTAFRSVAAAAAVTALLALPTRVAGAQDKVYPLNEVSTQPRLAAPSTALRLIQNSYPTELRRSGVAGEVEIQFVVNTNGKVDPSSVEVVDATVPALGEAAKAVVKDLEFTPAKVGNTTVRARVVLPIAYRP